MQQKRAASLDSQPLIVVGQDGKLGRIRDWKWEMVSILLAFCLLAAMVVILAQFNNQQQPQWPWASTLNLSTLIALLATVFRALLEKVLGAGEYASFNSL